MPDLTLPPVAPLAEPDLPDTKEPEEAPKKE